MEQGSVGKVANSNERLPYHDQNLPRHYIYVLNDYSGVVHISFSPVSGMLSNGMNKKLLIQFNKRLELQNITCLEYLTFCNEFYYAIVFTCGGLVITS